MLDRLRNRLLRAWATGVTTHHYLTLLAALALVAAALWITLIGIPLGPRSIGPMQFQSDRNDLLSRDLEWNQRFIHWWETFEGMNDLWIVVDTWQGGQPREDGVMRTRALVDELGAALQQHPLVNEVVWRFDTTEIHPRAVRMSSMESFIQHMAEMREAEVLLASASPRDLLNRISTRMMVAGEAMDETQAMEQLASLRQLIDAMGAVLAAGRDAPVDFAAAMLGEQQAQAMRWQYLTDVEDDPRHFYIRVEPVLEGGALSAAEDAIAATRQIMAEVAARHPGVELGLTGVEVVEADETRVATIDSAKASAIAVVLITMLLIVSFHSWRVPVMAMLALLCGIAWSFGYVTLAIGHLQVLSVVFAVILLGLGIAFGIHLASRLEMIRHEYEDTTEGFIAAMRDTFQTMGPGMMTAAITTAAAFATMMFTKFQGLAEMGEIAAAGILLCFIAMLSVFPALLRKYKRRHRHIVPFESRKLHVFEERWVMPFARHPKFTLIGIAIVTLIAGAAAMKVRFDYNLLNLVPRGVESVEWQDRLIRDAGRPLWYGVSIVTDLDQARQLAAQYRQLPNVAELGGVGMLFPPEEECMLEEIRRTREALSLSLQAALRAEAGPAIEQPATQPQQGLIEQLSSFRFLMAAYILQAPAELRPHLTALGQSMDRVIATANALPPEEREARLARLDETYAAFREQTAHQIDQALDESPLTIEEIPASLRSLYYASQTGEYVLEVYPQLPPGVSDPLEPAFLEVFVKDLRMVDPLVTGASPQYYDSGLLIWDSYRRAGLYAILAVFVLVLIDFRSLPDALLSLAPVVVGFIWALGVMSITGLDLNPANIIVLPLVFGIGVDSGVHILHRYRQDPVSRPLGLTAGTGKGITITSLTAMIGFASMIPAQHLGIRSLGLTLTLGIGMILLACWILMPAWLELRQARQKKH